MKKKGSYFLGGASDLVSREEERTSPKNVFEKNHASAVRLALEAFKGAPVIVSLTVGHQDRVAVGIFCCKRDRLFPQWAPQITRDRLSWSSSTVWAFCRMFFEKSFQGMSRRTSRPSSERRQGPVDGTKTRHSSGKSVEIWERGLLRVGPMGHVIHVVLEREAPPSPLHLTLATENWKPEDGFFEFGIGAHFAHCS